MSELPSGWAETSLGEIVTLRAEKTDPATVPNKPFIGLDGIEPHTSEIINVGKAADVKSTVACFEAGDVLYSRLRPYLNKVATPNFNGVASAEIYALQPTGASDAEFVRRRIMTTEFLEFAALLDKGDRPRVSFKDISTFPIALPPKAEQRRIVEKVDSLTASTARARTELERVPDLIARYKRSLLGRTFERLAAKHGTQPLAELTTKIGSGATPRGGSSVYVEQGTPFIRSQNVYFEGFEYEGLAYIDDAAAKALSNVTTEENDVLVNITGASIGRATILPDELAGGRLNQHVSILRCKPNLLNSFLLYFLWSPEMQKLINDENYGVTRQALTKSMIEGFLVPLPPLEEQAEIVRRIESAFGWIDRMASEHASATKLLPKLDGAILARAFRGKLVPQDPNDEPATALLERVSEDRASHKLVKTSSKRNRKTRTQTPRKAKVTMTKSRHDEDVWQKPYLAGLLRQSKSAKSPEEMFSLSDLQLVDFYHQLSTEYEKGWLVEVDGQVKAT